jgi:hypothetical protein
MMPKIKSRLGRLKVITDILNWLTGRSARHNRALRNIREWAATVQKFLTEYQLYGSPDVNVLLKNLSQAKFDLIDMSHKGHPLAMAAARISHARVSPLLIRVIDEVDNTRRAMMNPSLRVTTLPEVVSRLRISFEKLQEKLSEIDYL